MNFTSQTQRQPRVVFETTAPAHSAPAPTKAFPGVSYLDVHRFRLRGFLTLEKFCLEPELSTIKTTLNRLFSDRTGYEEGCQFDMLGLDENAERMSQPQILNPSTYAPSLLQSQHFHRLTAIAKQLLGPNAQFSFDHAILKPARSKRATPWHQDEAHQTDSRVRYRQISFWMPLQATPIESGCMRYIPGTNRGEILAHRRFKNDPRVHALECAPHTFDESRALMQPVGPGACILHDGRTVHSALPNFTAYDRLAYIVAFIGPPQPKVASGAYAKHSGFTANQKRHRHWLWRGGFITVAARRLRQGIRSKPELLLKKVCLQLKSFLHDPK